ncbi:MAG: DNA methyltransferase [Chloroflexota bacterium]|nr:DNA methyltransferase [Chloroflexota bacterium]MDE2911239.1 DNA methyltransferase [Chloroflexota bacterium]
MDTSTRKLYRGDCLEILQDYLEPDSVDLIYLDPPFNSKSNYNLPFRGKDKTHTAVQAFVDTWTWKPENDIRLAEFRRSGDPYSSIATVIDFAQQVEDLDARTRKRESSLAAYLLNMADRLIAMKPILRDTGSIYLHCDPTASHYLKLVMDTVFGKSNFRNEIVWAYRTGGVSARWFGRKHDIILFYSKSDKYSITVSKERSYNRDNKPYRFSGVEEFKDEEGRWYTMATMRDVWEINAIGRTSAERLGYPTQKPLALLDRIIEAACPSTGVVLDPFCGCGTTVHAAEDKELHWIGVDISRFAVELIRERVQSNFAHRLRDLDSISIIGLPEDITDARQLARMDPFEFEKWICGRIGSNGLGKRLGARGADGGIDGIIELDTVQDQKVVKETAIVQVKGGNVSADSVRALSEVVRRTGSVAGILVCFKEQASTVENQRSRDTWSDASGTYPVIQSFSVEDLLEGKRPLLPPRYGRRRGGRITA